MQKCSVCEFPRFWQCSSCTVKNESKDKECKCGQKKDGVWTCVGCKALNEGSLEVCSDCRAARKRHQDESITIESDEDQNERSKAKAPRTKVCTFSDKTAAHDIVLCCTTDIALVV